MNTGIQCQNNYIGTPHTTQCLDRYCLLLSNAFHKHIFPFQFLPLRLFLHIIYFRKKKMKECAEKLQLTVLQPREHT